MSRRRRARTLASYSRSARCMSPLCPVPRGGGLALVAAGSGEDRTRRDVRATDERLRLTVRESTVAELVAEG
ncbi:hypothetical protein ACFTY8_34185 [Streptomyces mirabilis]|uniref:hypothetical protein n=1 Tax=Streptomyces mirabilis TaxID=68239 RepID=UPI00363BBEC1